MATTEEKKKTRRPTAQKRDLRNGKHQMINKSFKSKARTVVRSFEEALTTPKNRTQAEEALRSLYSMMDQAAKRGIYTRNKAARLKSRATSKLASLLV